MQRLANRGVAQSFAEGVSAINSNGQYYTNGRILFSYGEHWPVAAWIDGQLHINDDRYSVTTSKHRTYAIGGVVRAGLAHRLDNAVHHANTASIIAACRAANLMH